MKPITTQLVAFAHVADVERSIRFYADLGFTVGNSVAGEGGDGRIWAWLESGSAHLMVGRADGPVDAGLQAVLFYLYCDDVEQARAALDALGHRPGPIKRPFYMPAGEFRLLDPDGYVLMIAQSR
ncbi:VOC family protein [Lysobacter auxotrophicus]|uniref:VOC family protein n=1 Tax=Lysobacter auxotrophicus TaxID=2992573 RepID=A0ABN6UK14_9GAMM|nr:VOC family protein [Lysobacter auxotrophicus]BDU16576.1 VOC family protein [Lysobacter auxotrophicus]